MVIPETCSQKIKPPPLPGSVGRSYEDDVECNQILRFPLIYTPHFICFFLLLSVALEVLVLELSSKKHRPRREKTCFLGFRQSESQLNRLDRKLFVFFARGKSCDDSSQKADDKVMILRGCAGWSGPLLLQITEDS